MNLFVLLMCGGKQTRMGAYEGAKQLVPVLGEPNAVRTVRMLREGHTAGVTVMAPNTREWNMAASEMHALRIDSTDPLFLAALAEALPIGRGGATCLILCGDVVFSPGVLARLVYTAGVTFTGRFSPNIHTGRAAGELYGFSYAASQRDLVLFHLNAILAEVETLKETMQGINADEAQINDVVEKNARLWRFMHTMEEAGATVADVDLWDYIDDIDGPDDLERLPRIEAAIRRRV